MMALGPAIALMAARDVEGFGPFEKTCLVLAFAGPLGARPLATLLPLPIGAFTMMAAFALIVWNAARRRLGGVEAVRDGLNAKNSQGPETAIWLGAAVDALRARPDQMESFEDSLKIKELEHAGIEKDEQVCWDML